MSVVLVSVHRAVWLPLRPREGGTPVGIFWPIAPTRACSFLQVQTASAGPERCSGLHTSSPPSLWLEPSTLHTCAPAAVAECHPQARAVHPVADCRAPLRLPLRSASCQHQPREAGC